jgi:hypothetical protein
MSIKPNRKTRNSRLSKIQQTWIKPPKDKPWVRIFVEDMDGEKWRGLTVTERRVWDALACQHFRYFQRNNGELQVSYAGFKRSGALSMTSVAAAIRKMRQNGMIKTRPGINPDPYLKAPSLYSLSMYEKREGIIAHANKQFVWLPIEVMESAAWCRLSLSARRIMDRLLIENLRHNGELNGKLRVSYDQLIGHGIRRRLIAPALKELTDSGFVTIKKGHRPQKDYARINLYRLNFYGTIDGPAIWEADPETNVIDMPSTAQRTSKKEVLCNDSRSAKAI